MIMFEPANRNNVRTTSFASLWQNVTCSASKYVSNIIFVKQK